MSRDRFVECSGGVSAIVLAAGLSKRFGKFNKLLAEMNGLPLITHTLRAVQAGKFFSVVVVVPTGNADLARLARHYEMEICENPNRQLGMGASIACGASYLHTRFKDLSGVAIFLGDMPKIHKSTIATLKNRFVTENASKIVRPAFQGNLGHPVIFPACKIKQLMNLNADAGAKELVDERNCICIDVSDPCVIFDVDRPEHLGKCQSN